MSRFGQDHVLNFVSSKSAVGESVSALAQGLRDMTAYKGQKPDQDDPFDDSVDMKGGGKGGGGKTNGKNFDPEAQNKQGDIDEDGVLRLSLLDGAIDKNNDPLVVTEINGQAIAANSWITLASGARAMVEADGTLVYDAAGAFDALNEGETAKEVLTYTLSDPRGGTASASIDIEIAGVSEPVNPAPDAIDDVLEVSAVAATTLEILQNDVDAAGGGLEIIAINGVSVVPGSHLHLPSGAEIDIFPDGSITYDPTASASFGDGETSDGFNYTVRDANGNIDTAETAITLIDDGSGGGTDPGPDPHDAPYYVEALLAGDALRLNADADYGTSETVSFAFAEAPPYYYPSSSYVQDTFQTFTEQQRDAARDILDQIASFTNLTFVEVPADQAEMVFGIADMSGDTLGTAFYPSADGSGLFDSDIWIDTDVAGSVFEPGTLGYATLLHEIGHSIGLKHPDADLLNWAEATRMYTVMGYGDHAGAEEDASSFMLYDIAALQHLYGVNPDGKTGDDLYQIEDDVLTVWDAGGNDTLDFSHSAHGATISLEEGTFSSSGDQFNNVALAFGTTIENAIGTDHDDVIAGNDQDNVLDGGLGNDTLTGGAGSDRFAFDLGNSASVITDFSSGEDALDLGGLLLSDLMIETVDDNLLISKGSDWSVTLENVSEITEDDLHLI